MVKWVEQADELAHAPRRRRKKGWGCVVRCFCASLCSKPLPLICSSTEGDGKHRYRFSATGLSCLCKSALFRLILLVALERSWFLSRDPPTLYTRRMTGALHLLLLLLLSMWDLSATQNFPPSFSSNVESINIPEQQEANDSKALEQTVRC